MSKKVAKGLNIVFLGWIANIVLSCIALALDEKSDIRGFLPWLGYLVMLVGFWTAKEGEETFGKALGGMVAFFCFESMEMLLSKASHSDEPTGGMMVMSILGTIAYAVMIYYVCDGVLRALYELDASHLEKRSNTVWYIMLASTVVNILTIGLIALQAKMLGGFMAVLSLILSLVANVFFGMMLYSSSAYLSKVDDQAETEPEQKEP